MCLLILVLNKVECLEDILKEFCKEGYTGATVLDSQGMAQSLCELDRGYDELRFLGSLRSLLDPEHRQNKTVFMVTREENIKPVSAIVNRVTGGLEHANTGVLFALPVMYTEGIEEKK